MKKNEILPSLINKYNLSKDDIKYIFSIIEPIYKHKEFKRRMTKEFLHHDETTLGYHLLEDTIVAYKICRKKKLNNNETKIAIIIAILHDMYENPWQNNLENKKDPFFYKHGFRHPIEAVINSITWFPEYFQNKNEAYMIIDGIIHHMYPLPVVRVTQFNYQYLFIKNINKYDKLEKKYKDMIYLSTSRHKLFNLSIAKSISISGRIVSKADKISSLDNFSSLSGITALLTGKNSHIKK